MPPCRKQELTQRNNKDVQVFPSSNIEHFKHQTSFELFLYVQLGKLQQMPFQESLPNKKASANTETSQIVTTIHRTGPATAISTKPLPETHRIAMKQAQKENTTSAAPRTARPHPLVTKKTSPDCWPAGNKNSPSATTRRFISFLQPT